MYKISQLENIGVKFRELLLAAGIDNQEQLLQTCDLRAKRKALAEKTGINPKLILRWTQHADLVRINGIGEEYAELLVHSNILSVQMLCELSPDKLLSLLKENNERSKLVRSLPSLSNIVCWIEHAKKLPARLEI